MNLIVRSLHCNRAKSLALGLVALLAANAGVARAEGGSPTIEPAITRPYREIALRFKYQGLVAEVKVEEGDVVTKNQLLMIQDSAEEALELKSMSAEAFSDLTVLAARANLKEKELELQKVQQIHDGGAQNDLELAKAKTDVEVAALQVKKEQQDLDVKKIKVQKQEELIKKMQLLSPEAGVVQSVGAHVGEFVDPSKPPVVTVIQNNPLLVEVQLAPTVGSKLKMGRELRVSYDRKEWKTASVYYLAPMADAASGLQTVKLTLKNDEGTASGGEMWVEIPADVAVTGHEAAAVAK